MARRVSWTNNSSGHSGTYVYRAPTLDPQNLPAPVATVDPVAQGATAEWVDSEMLTGGNYDYAVQGYDGSDVSALSDVIIHAVESLSIQHVADGAWASTTSGTLITTSAPANIQEGDLLVCGIMHREELTAPPGWTLAISAGPTTGQFPQSTAFFTRVATADDISASYDWAQASANRMQAQISAFRSSFAIGVVDTFTATGAPSVATNEFPLADATSTEAGQIVVSGCSVELHNVGGGEPAESAIIPVADWTQITPITGTLPPGEARRLCAGWLAVNAPNTHGGFLQRDPNGDTLAPDESHYASAAILIGEVAP